MKHALIFDLDGTIFKTESIVLKAYRQTFHDLARMGFYHGAIPSDAEFLSTLGKIIPEIWAQLLPGASPEIKSKAAELMGNHEEKLLKSGEGMLFHGVDQTLTALKNRGCLLYVASNGTQHYIETVAYYTGIKNLFSGLYSSGGRKTKNKTELVKILLEENEISSKNAVIIGDRFHDVAAGKELGLKVIGCKFGYGALEELKEADIIIDSFPEIMDGLAALKIIA
mgnify:CR=1 FL=1